MGNDGGSIPTRRELVKNAARDPNTTELKATQLESQTHAWTYCPLSQRLLAAPIVSDCAGVLYNKDAIIEFLLPSDNLEPNTTRGEYEIALSKRIKNIRDIVDVTFKTEIDRETKHERRLCPVTSRVLGPSTKSVYLVPCGNAFSETAIKEVAGVNCLECSQPFEQNDVIAILPLVQSEIDRMAERIKALTSKGLTHALKNIPGSKKRKKHEAERAAAATKSQVEVTKSGAESGLESKPKEVMEIDAVTSSKDKPSLGAKAITSVPTGGIKNAATASLTARVLDEQEERNKRRKLGLNDNLQSLFSKTASNPPKQGGGDFLTRGYSIPKNR